MRDRPSPPPRRTPANRTRWRPVRAARSRTSRPSRHACRQNHAQSRPESIQEGRLPMRSIRHHPMGSPPASAPSAARIRRPCPQRTMNPRRAPNPRRRRSCPAGLRSCPRAERSPPSPAAVAPHILPCRPESRCPQPWHRPCTRPGRERSATQGVSPHFGRGRECGRDNARQGPP